MAPPSPTPHKSSLALTHILPGIRINRQSMHHWQWLLRALHPTSLPQPICISCQGPGGYQTVNHAPVTMAPPYPTPHKSSSNLTHILPGIRRLTDSQSGTSDNSSSLPYTPQVFLNSYPYLARDQEINRQSIMHKWQELLPTLHGVWINDFVWPTYFHFALGDKNVSI